MPAPEPDMRGQWELALPGFDNSKVDTLELVNR
jgi:hypothetical protein